MSSDLLHNQIFWCILYSLCIIISLVFSVWVYRKIKDIKDIISNFIKYNKKVLIFNLSWGYDANNGNYLKSISNNKNIYFACRDHYSYNILNETYTFANKPYL